MGRRDALYWCDWLLVQQRNRSVRSRLEAAPAGRGGDEAYHPHPPHAYGSFPDPPASGRLRQAIETKKCVSKKNWL
jgi:hypothetical protein